MLNAKLLHQIQSFSKVITVLVLPHVIHVNPLDIHVGVLLGLDHIQINESLLLGPKQVIASEDSTGIHIWVDLPSRDKLRKWNLVHALGGFLVLASGGLDIALGGTGALWSFILIAQTLGASVTTGIGTASRSTGATT